MILCFYPLHKFVRLKGLVIIVYGHVFTYPDRDDSFLLSYGFDFTIIDISLRMHKLNPLK
jgi:hypothetical protein